MDDVKPRPLLADCPYCRGSGVDALVWDRRCGHCNGHGRMARFMAEEILARWAANGWPGAGHVGLAVDGRTAGSGGDADEYEEGEDGNGSDGGGDDDPGPPRPYRLRPAA